MSTKMLLTTKLDQRLVMSPQLSQAITLLQYNTIDLKQLVQQYIQTNPLIDIENTEAFEIDQETNESHSSLQDNEVDTQQFNLSADLSRAQRYSGDETSLENYSIPVSLRNHLLDQTLLCQFNPKKQIIAEAIIDAVDENGQLTMSLTEIQQSLSTHTPSELNLIETVLQKIQTFDPPGIAFRDLRECLLIQIEHLSKPDNTWNIAKEILSKYFETLSVREYKSIMKNIRISQQTFNDALSLIQSLNPKPGLQYSNENNINIEPELYVKKIKNTWRVFLSESILTNIKINHQYHDLIKQNKKHDSYAALNKELQEAQWLLKGLQRRNETLINVATHIVKLQTDFLDFGLTFMKPMNIIDISQALNLHESTVSRVTTGKYIATPRGVFELKYFFPSYVLTQSGEMCSDTAVKEMIKDIISGETHEHIYSDNEIAVMLKQKGINIARRTVAKYREALKILPSYQRAQHRLTVSSNND